MKYFIQPFGCQMNRSDSERIETVLEGMGFRPCSDENDPDIAIKGIIACSVRQKAIDRVYGRIRNWNLAKADHPCITFITGCILDADREKFLKLFDLIFPVDQLPELPDMIRQYGVVIPGEVPGSPLQERNMKAGDSPRDLRERPDEDTSLGAGSPAAVSKTFHSVPFTIGAPEVDKPGREEATRRIEDFWKLRPQYSSAVEAYVPIQNGCDKFCTFCAVPYTRGREVSRPSADILDEVRYLVDNGCKSITLLGQNVNSYGLDKKGAELNFSELMRAVGEIGNKTGREFWTYFTSPHPRDITTDLLEVMAEYPVLADWVHLPLQSGDDKVLLKMNRNHSMDRYRKVVDDIRRILPDATLFTDIIVGFNGENEEQFQATADAMREFRYDMAYIAQYSPRPGARSSRWEDDIPKEEKERRFHALGDLLTEIAAPFNQARIGQTLRVLLTGTDRKEGYLSGYIEGRIPVRVKAPAERVGGFVDVEIVAARPLSIEGRLAPAVSEGGR